MLAFVIPAAHCHMAPNGVHRGASYQSQQQTLAHLCPIRAYAPLELVHFDYTSIESTMELNKPSMVKNVLVMTDHFMKYALAVVMKDQMAKTPTKLLSDWGMNFTSALVEELCSAFGIQKCRTMAYHTQCNGQMEHFHQTLFHVIAKLSCDKKAQ